VEEYVRDLGSTLKEGVYVQSDVELIGKQQEKGLSSGVPSRNRLDYERALKWSYLSENEKTAGQISEKRRRKAIGSFASLRGAALR